MRGGWEREKAASDHRAVVVHIERRRTGGRRRIKHYAVAHEDFQQAMQDDEALTEHVRDPNIRYQSIVLNAFAAQRRILPRLSACAARSPQYVADKCLSLFRSLRAGRDDQAMGIVTEVLELQRCAREGMIDVRKVGEVLQDALDCAATLEIKALERSAILELQKAQKRQRLKVRMQPFRIRKKQMALDGVYDAAGEIILDAAAVGAAIAAEWAPTFAARQVDSTDMQWFLQHVPRGAGRTEWPSGRLREIAANMPRSSPGPDGLTYEFWAAAPESALAFLDKVATDATRCISLPEALLHSFTVFIPKGEYAADAERIIRRITELRPIVLMQTAAKLMAATANDELATIADRTACAPQWGFVRGRQLADNVIVVEGGLEEFSQLVDSLLAIILLDFAQAFPPLSHCWMFAVLSALESTHSCYLSSWLSTRIWSRRFSSEVARSRA